MTNIVVESATESAVDDQKLRDRSPSFPFIGLKKAIGRAETMESEFRQHPARVVNVVEHWGYKPKSSGGLQTIATLKAYGLLSDTGSGKHRKVQLTDLARQILKDTRPGAKETGIKKAALRPKLFAKIRADWGLQRPPDSECISELTLERGFSDIAARRFLKVYDEIIAFSKLSDSDILSGNEQDKNESENEPDDFITPPPPPPPPPGGKVMEGERVVFTDEMTPNHHVRVIVSGPVDADLLDSLDDYSKRQRKRLGRQLPSEPETPEEKETPESDPLD